MQRKFAFFPDHVEQVVLAPACGVAEHDLPNGPGTHTADSDPALLFADGFVRQAAIRARRRLHGCTNMNLLPITAEFAASPLVTNSDFLSGLCTATLSMYPGGVPEMPWAGYLAEENGVLVGTCAFKSPPVSGSVEIAYFTFPQFEGRGIATRMAQDLVALAVQHGVIQVRAQTLPETGASTRILKKLGFTRVGTVSHPEDGDVWEWQRDNRTVPSS